MAPAAGGKEGRLFASVMSLSIQWGACELGLENEQGVNAGSRIATSLLSDSCTQSYRGKAEGNTREVTRG